mgnify:CR=1 FL=1
MNGQKNSYKECTKTSKILRVVFIFVAGPMLQDFSVSSNGRGMTSNTDEFAQPGVRQ